MTRGVRGTQLPGLAGGPSSGSGTGRGAGRDAPLALPEPPAGFDFSSGAMGASAPGQEPHADIFRTFHKRLRGRYLLASVLGVICAVAGGAAGYYSQKPTYKCETMVRIVMMDVVLVRQDQEYQNRINQFNSIVSTQASFIQSARVQSKAMESPGWAELGRPRTPEVERQFQDSLKVVPQRDSPELISVSFLDPDPKAAKAGLEGVISAYDDIYVKAENAGGDRTRLAALEEMQRQHSAEIRRLESEISEATKNLATSNVGMFQAGMVDQIIRLDGMIAELKLKIATVGAPAPGTVPANGAANPGTPKAITPYEIAQSGDQEMADLIAKRRGYDDALDKLMAGGATQENREVKRVKGLLEITDKKIKDYAEKWNNEGGLVKDVSVLGATRPETHEQMVARLGRLEDQREKWNLEGIKYKELEEQVKKKREQIAENRAHLTEVNEALIDMRSKMSVRQAQPLVQIDRDIPTPRAPAFDRRKKVGAIGFVLGGMLPFGLFLLYGMIDRRFRYSDQAGDQSAGLPLLGILPELPSNLSDPEEAAAAAHCVHQMRTMLQISGGSRKVYAITSATSGDGKTCLTLSLGLSFAASGSRTLLIDFDLIGQGLSSKLKMRPEHGMASSLESGELAESVVATKIDRLFLLPAGRHDEEFVSRLSTSMVRDAIDAVRDQYDVIIIDTGPVLGSLEANFVTSQAEGVVLVVGRNQHRSLVQRAEQHLITLGARVIGQVFNRALSTDFRSSISSASMRSTRSTPSVPVTAIQVAKVDDSLLELDPVSRTVALDIRR